ncbi:hypothetical protein, partial [Streptococcus pneumoniae]|uniref:hypothetical protein n=1 Tax=Streptococcus pneumoniae TaxID=1313 RepID=UPI0018B024F1
LVFALLTGLVGCIDGGINIGGNTQAPPSPTEPGALGLPGDACGADADCLSKDCNDAERVCR